MGTCDEHGIGTMWLRERFPCTESVSLAQGNVVLYIESAIICSSKCLAYPSLMQLFQAIRENKNWVLLGYVNRDDHGKHANTKKKYDRRGFVFAACM